jgi:hypothetical protein
MATPSEAAMDKTLDSIQLTHRILMALVLALVLLSLSAQRPSGDYDDMQDELSALQDAISEAREFREARNKEIFDASSLKSAISEWIKSKHLSDKGFGYEIIEPDHVRVPDSEVNPLVTVADQVLWADKLFDLTETTFYMCQINKIDLFSAIDRSPLSSNTGEVVDVILDMKKTWDNFVVQKRTFCVMTIYRSISDGHLSGTEGIELEVPARLTAIDSVEGSDKNYEGLHHILKDHGLGDFEDTHEIGAPAIRAYWSEIGQKTPPNALSYIKKIEEDTSEKRKTRIELLGQSMDAALSLSAGSFVLLALLIFMYMNIVHLPGI